MFSRPRLVLAVALASAPPALAQHESATPGAGSPLNVHGLSVTFLSARAAGLEEYRATSGPFDKGWAGGGVRLAFFVKNRQGAPMPPALGEIRVLFGTTLYNPVTNPTSSKPLSPLVIIRAPLLIGARVEFEPLWWSPPRGAWSGPRGTMRAAGSSTRQWRVVRMLPTPGAENMNGVVDANRLADDLESLRAGTLIEADFRGRWQGAVASEPLDAIWPNLEHYFADLDIRRRDPKYRAMQNREIDKLVTLLRAGAANDALAKINFLRCS